MAARPRSPSPRPLAVAVLAAALLLSACGGRPSAPPAGGKLLAGAPASPPDAGTVDLRVYLRSGSGAEAHLLPVPRRAAIGTDLPRRALELLIAGPVEGDPKDLKAVLPDSTTIAAFAVEGDTAVVDLSPEAVGDAARVGPSAEHELLALAAVANTLTEFPAIDHVRLTVAGRGGEFWGGWGLPPLLTRDEQVIGPPSQGDGLPSPTRFGIAEQRVGSASAGAVAVAGVRAVDRIGFVRVIVELADAGGQTAAPGVPPTVAAIENDRLVLRIEDVVSSAADPAPGQRLALENLPFGAIEADAGALPGPAVFALPDTVNPFLLHTLTSPTRIVLDVRK